MTTLPTALADDARMRLNASRASAGKGKITAPVTEADLRDIGDAIVDAVVSDVVMRTFRVP
jgi:hypothetical protein